MASPQSASCLFVQQVYFYARARFFSGAHPSGLSVGRRADYDRKLFKLLLLLSYIYAISCTPFIKRVFQYHGAEHKVINCYEQNLPVTVENVQRQSRLHYRCGSSFILFTVIVGMFVYLLVPTDPLWVRILNRLALIPVVLGISFEVLQLTNKLRDIPVLKVLGYPGLWLQLLTTKEPSDDQVEVAIASFNELLHMETKAEDEQKEPSNIVM